MLLHNSFNFFEFGNRLLVFDVLYWWYVSGCGAAKVIVKFLRSSIGTRRCNPVRLPCVTACRPDSRRLQGDVSSGDARSRYRLVLVLLYTFVLFGYHSSSFLVVSFLSLVSLLVFFLASQSSLSRPGIF